MKWTILAFAFPAEAGAYLPTSKRNSLPKTTTWQLSQLLAAQAVTPHWATGARELSIELTTSRAASRDANHWATELPIM